MLSLKDNIRAVLECNFSQCKEELIESATNNIHALFINKIKKIKIVINEVEEDKGELDNGK